MSANKWTIVRKISRKLGPVWVVTRDKNGRKQKGYFKFSTRKIEPPMAKATRFLVSPFY